VWWKVAKENLMKKELSFMVTSAILLLSNACGVGVIPGSGEIVEEVRDVHGFSQIVFSAPGELSIEQNGQEGLAIEADDNLLQYIETRVQGDTLHISVKPNMIRLYPSKPIRYALDVDMLTRVTLNGSGAIRSGELIASKLDFDLNGSGDVLIAAVKSKNTTLDLDGSGEYRLNSIMTAQFELSLDGSGDIVIKEALVQTASIEIDGSGKLRMTDVVADTLDMKIDGSGDSTLMGEVNHQAIAIHGSGSYDAGGLQSRGTTARIVGSGDSKIWVTDELDITITGSGGIAYRGNPAVTQTNTGSGDIVRLARQ